MTSVGPGTRVSSFHDFSKGWKSYNIKEDHKKNYSIALNGYSHLAQGGKNLYSEFSLPDKTYQKEFSQLRIFYGEATDGNKITLQDTISINLKGKNPVNEISVKNIHSLKTKITLNNATEQVMFGYSTESDTGVIVDNFSFRGSSGTWFTRYPEEQLKAWDSLMNYDLIILQYGVNVAQSKIKDYVWYKKVFNENLKYLRKCFPKTTILIVGCADRATKKNGEYHSLEGIPYLIETQQEMAAENNCSFLNLYELMGGEGAMVKWVSEKNANKDYTHFTHKGAEKVGKLLYEAINKEYLRFTNAQAGK
jgi:lysophospholipase L1-like esterase